MLGMNRLGIEGNFELACKIFIACKNIQEPRWFCHFDTWQALTDRYFNLPGRSSEVKHQFYVDLISLVITNNPP